MVAAARRWPAAVARAIARAVVAGRGATAVAKVVPRWMECHRCNRVDHEQKNPKVERMVPHCKYGLYRTDSWQWHAPTHGLPLAAWLPNFRNARNGRCPLWRGARTHTVNGQALAENTHTHEPISSPRTPSEPAGATRRAAAHHAAGGGGPWRIHRGRPHMRNSVSTGSTMAAHATAVNDAQSVARPIMASSSCGTTTRVV